MTSINPSTNLTSIRDTFGFNNAFGYHTKSNLLNTAVHTAKTFGAYDKITKDLNLDQPETLDMIPMVKEMFLIMSNIDSLNNNDQLKTFAENQDLQEKINAFQNKLNSFDSTKKIIEDFQEQINNINPNIKYSTLIRDIETILEENKSVIDLLQDINYSLTSFVQSINTQENNIQNPETTEVKTLLEDSISAINELITQINDDSSLKGINDINTTINTKLDPICKKMRIKNSSTLNIPKKIDAIFKRSHLLLTLSKIFDYIPILGTIFGIIKLVMINKLEKLLDKELEATKKKEDKELEALLVASKSFLKGMKVRSWIAVTSCGFILTVPDLIMSIGRVHSNKPATPFSKQAVAEEG